jgi:ribosomal protein S18 acetylase RimI-like enzyme
MSEVSQEEADIVYRICPSVTNEELNPLFAVSWPEHEWRDFQPVLSRSLTYICAFCKGQLIGFVNLAWDGGLHAFLLDPTVHPDWRRRGIGCQLVEKSVSVAQAHGVEWVHVDFDPPLWDFYRKCGFRPTEAGLIHLDSTSRA